VFERSAVFDFFARTCRQDEVFFLARLPAGASGEVTTGGWTELELDVLDELRWWGLEELAAAQAAGTEVYPRDLAEHVRGLLDGWDGVLRQIA
jgi:hypothetical protein